MDRAERLGGRLIVVVGPSGAGKDAVMAAAVAATPGTVIAQRVVTRPPDAASEDHATLDETAFMAQAAADAFAFWWRAHGLLYGVPRALDDDLAAGRTVLVNGSRAALAATRAARPEIEVVAVTAPRAVRAARLAARGREAASEIESRLGADAPPPPDCLAVIDNGGALADAAAALSAALRKPAAPVITAAAAPGEMLVLANAMLALETECLRGTVAIRDGEIIDVAAGAGVCAGAFDCEGDWLAPGLVELHTDNIERHLEPRPGVPWPPAAAIIAHDAEFAGVGVTTLYDALRVGSIQRGGDGDYRDYARATADVILSLRAAGALRIDHRLHLRAEICSETLIEELDRFGEGDGVGIISLMDHTPGQRQFRDKSKLVDYLRSKRAMTDAGIAAHFDAMAALQARVGAAHEAAGVAAARRLGAVLASHDDTTPGDVARSAAHGAGFAEFPTTSEAAHACRQAGVPVMMGAPNLLRGGSHSGNVAASDLADAGLLDILSSDYAPSSLLHGAVLLGQRLGAMAAGLRAATRAPALAVGLVDRGALAVGLRADLVRFSTLDGIPVTRGVWTAGHRVA